MYTPKYFNICPSSTKCYNRLMNEDPELAEKFARYEDRFLKYELDAMCEFFRSGECPNAMMRAEEMEKLHDKMVNMFDKKFSHHVVHIDMMKKHCKGDAPSKNMKGKMGC